MNPTDLQNLHEAYLDVYYDLDEGRSEDIKNKMIARYGTPDAGDSLRLHVARKKYTKAASRYQDGYGPHPDMGPEGKLTKGQMMYKAGRANRRKIKEDLSIILDYLLDEGYANSIEDAEVILENMSDKWLESIIEEIVE